MIPQITQIWDYIGSAWNNFQDKELVENFWAALASGNQYVFSHVSNVQFSRTIDYMYPTFDYGPETFIIVYSGLTTDLTVSPIVNGQEQVLNGGFETNTSGWISYGSVPFVRSNTYAHTGTWSIKLPANNSSAGAKYSFGGSQLPSSTLTAWFKLGSLPSTGQAGSIGLLAVDENDMIVAMSLAAVNTTAWQKVTIYSQLPNIRGLIVYSLTAVDVYVDDVSLQRTGYFEYALPEYTYSVPTITYKYTYNGVVYTGTYTENVDYLISSELNSLIWIGTIIPDRRYSDKRVLIGTADHVYRINPVLGDVWSRQCGFKIQTMYPSYGSFGQEKYTHLKQLIWSLDFYQQQAPSIYTLRNAYGIARGLPFAYESGIMSYTTVGGLYNVTIGGDTFIFPSGVRPGPIGYYDKFEVLASGLELYDYISNPSLINTYTNPYTRRSTLIYDLDASLSGISFSQDFLDTYMAKIIPEQIQYLTI
jgi:hypothetical protein